MDRQSEYALNQNELFNSNLNEEDKFNTFQNGFNRGQLTKKIIKTAADFDDEDPLEQSQFDLGQLEQQYIKTKVEKNFQGITIEETKEETKLETKDGKIEDNNSEGDQKNEEEQSQKQLLNQIIFDDAQADTSIFDLPDSGHIQAAIEDSQILQGVGITPKSLRKNGRSSSRKRHTIQSTRSKKRDSLSPNRSPFNISGRNKRNDQESPKNNKDIEELMQEPSSSKQSTIKVKSQNSELKKQVSNSSSTPTRQMNPPQLNPGKNKPQDSEQFFKPFHRPSGNKLVLENRVETLSTENNERPKSTLSDMNEAKLYERVPSKLKDSHLNLESNFDGIIQKLEDKRNDMLDRIDSGPNSPLRENMPEYRLPQDEDDQLSNVEVIDHHGTALKPPQIDDEPVQSQNIANRYQINAAEDDQTEETQQDTSVIHQKTDSNIPPIKDMLDTLRQAYQDIFDLQKQGVVTQKQVHTYDKLSRKIKNMSENLRIKDYFNSDPDPKSMDQVKHDIEGNLEVQVIQNNQPNYLFQRGINLRHGLIDINKIHEIIQNIKNSISEDLGEDPQGFQQLKDENQKWDDVFKFVANNPKLLVKMVPTPSSQKKKNKSPIKSPLIEKTDVNIESCRQKDNLVIKDLISNLSKSRKSELHHYESQDGCQYREVIKSSYKKNRNSSQIQNNEFLQNMLQGSNSVDHSIAPQNLQILQEDVEVKQLEQALQRSQTADKNERKKSAYQRLQHFYGQQYNRNATNNLNPYNSSGNKFSSPYMTQEEERVHILKSLSLSRDQTLPKRLDPSLVSLECQERRDSNLNKLRRGQIGVFSGSKVPNNQRLETYIFNSSFIEGFEPPIKKKRVNVNHTHSKSHVLADSQKTKNTLETQNRIRIRNIKMKQNQSFASNVSQLGDLSKYSKGLNPQKDLRPKMYQTVLSQKYGRCESESRSNVNKLERSPGVEDYEPDFEVTSPKTDDIQYEVRQESVKAIECSMKKQIVESPYATVTPYSQHQRSRSRERDRTPVKIGQLDFAELPLYHQFVSDEISFNHSRSKDFFRESEIDYVYQMIKDRYYDFKHGGTNVYKPFYLKGIATLEKLMDEIGVIKLFPKMKREYSHVSFNHFILS